jgi:hypothetical protein
MQIIASTQHHAATDTSWVHGVNCVIVMSPTSHGPQWTAQSLTKQPHLADAVKRIAGHATCKDNAAECNTHMATSRSDDGTPATMHSQSGTW